VRIALDPDEDFVSVAPSGRWLMTEFAGSMCLRAGVEYAERQCVPIDDLDSSWSPTWSPDESMIAVVRAGSSRGGERNDAVWVFDVKGLSLEAVTPTDAWLAGSPVPYWLTDDQLGYTWSVAAETELRIWSTDGRTRVVGHHRDLDVDGLLRAGRDGALVQAEIGRQRGVYLLTAEGGVEQVLYTGERGIVAVDPKGERIVTQVLDAHEAGPLNLTDLATGRETGLAAVPVPSTFSPDGEHLAGVRPVSATEYQLGVWSVPSAGPVTPTEPQTTTISLPERTYFYDGAFWTSAGVVLPCSTDGEPQTVLLFATPTTGNES